MLLEREEASCWREGVDDDNDRKSRLMKQEESAEGERSGLLKCVVLLTEGEGAGWWRG